MCQIAESESDGVTLLVEHRTQVHNSMHDYRYRYRLLYYLNSDQLRAGLHAPNITLIKQ